MKLNEFHEEEYSKVKKNPEMKALSLKKANIYVFLNVQIL